MAPFNFDTKERCRDCTVPIARLYAIWQRLYAYHLDFVLVDGDAALHLLNSGPIRVLIEEATSCTVYAFWADYRFEIDDELIAFFGHIPKIDQFRAVHIDVVNSLLYRIPTNPRLARNAVNRFRSSQDALARAPLIGPLNLGRSVLILDLADPFSANHNANFVEQRAYIFVNH